MSNIKSFLEKSFQSLESSILLPFNKIGHYLVKAAKSISYVETLGKHADSLHLWIKKSYDCDFKRAFELEVNKALRYLRVSFARLAVDFTHEPFYGKTRGLYIINTPPDKTYDGEFQYISVCLITRGKQIPLMALPVRVGEGIAKLTIDLLEYCKTKFKKLIFAVFDRGFYVAELIDYLGANGIKYIIRVPEKEGKLTGFVEDTLELESFQHEMKYTKKKSTWKPKTNIVVCKGIDDFAWIFATNIKFNTRSEYIWYYTRRWQIETNYRVEDEGRIKSKSTNYMIRYFYFLVGQLLHIYWIVNKNINSYMPYKKYLDVIESRLLYNYRGIGDLNALI